MFVFRGERSADTVKSRLQPLRPDQARPAYLLFLSPVSTFGKPRVFSVGALGFAEVSESQPAGKTAEMLGVGFPG